MEEINPATSKQEIMPESTPKVLTREQIIEKLSSNIMKVINMTFGREYIDLTEASVVREALKTVDKKIKRWMRRQ